MKVHLGQRVRYGGRTWAVEAIDGDRVTILHKVARAVVVADWLEPADQAESPPLQVEDDRLVTALEQLGGDAEPPPGWEAQVLASTTASDAAIAALAREWWAAEKAYRLARDDMRTLMQGTQERQAALVKLNELLRVEFQLRDRLGALIDGGI